MIHDMKRFPLLMLAALCSTALQAQVKPLDHDAYDGWQSVRNVKISPDGKLLAWEVTPQEGDGTLFLRRLDSGAEISVPRGTALKWAQDGAWGLFTVKAPFAETRQARIDKKKKDEQPKDSLARIDLRSLVWDRIGVAGKTELGYEAAPYLFAAQEVKGRKSKSVLVINTASGAVDTLKNVSDFTASKSGARLVTISAKEEKDSLSRSAVILYDFPKGSIDTLSADRKTYADLCWNDAGDKVLFTATDDEEETDGTPRHGIYLAQERILQKATRRTPAVTEWRSCELLSAESEDLPEGWVVSAGSQPQFSNRSSRVILELAEYYPARDTTVYDFEAAQLDIWVWNQRNLPPMDKAARGREPQRTAVINLDRPGRLIVLSRSSSDRIRFFDGAEAPYALSRNTEPYDIDNMWAADSRTDVALVNLQDGSRRPLREGAKGYTSPSTYGKYLAWFNPVDGNWYSIDLATGAQVNLTGATGVAFWDEEDDHPTGGYVPIELPDWAGADEALLLCDRYDVWRFSPDGRKAECLTRGAGRRDRVQYRVFLPDDRSNPYLYQDIEPLPMKGELTLSAFNEVDRSRCP